MILRLLEENFSVCQIQSIGDINWEDKFVFIAKTDDELSLVCQTDYVPETCIQVEHDFKGFKIEGVLDFSLIGIIAKISKILANHHIGIFVISTFNTDYILVKGDQIPDAMDVLGQAGYEF